MKHIIIFLLAIFMSTGCASYTVKKYGKIDKREKTIIIKGFSKSIPDIKWALRKAGWKVKYSADGSHQVGRSGPATDLTTKTNYNARYRLEINEMVRDAAWVIYIDLYIIDNKTQEEVLYLKGDSNGAGGAWPEDTAEKLIEALNEMER